MNNRHKLISFVFVLSLCLMTVGTAQDTYPVWAVENRSGNQSIRGVCAVTPGTAWAVGEVGTVLRRDGPNSWTGVTVIPVNQTDYDFNDVFFLDLIRGWVVAENRIPQDNMSVVYWTADGGANWTKGNVPPNFDWPTPFLRIQFSDGNNGYITCGNGYVLKSADGGQHWALAATPQHQNQLIEGNSIWYNGLWVNPGNPQDVRICGDCFGQFAHTQDGGNTWPLSEIETPVDFGGPNMGYHWTTEPNKPFGERLANGEMAMQSGVNNGWVGLNLGNIGHYTGTWQRHQAEPEGSGAWFSCMTTSAQADFWLAGSYGVVQNIVPPGVNNHVFARNYIDFKSLDCGGNNVIYAGGKIRGSGNVVASNIYRRYIPFVLSGPAGLEVEALPPTDARVWVSWETEPGSENNIKQWHIKMSKFNYLNGLGGDMLTVAPGGSPYLVHFDLHGGTYTAGLYHFQLWCEIWDDLYVLKDQYVYVGSFDIQCLPGGDPPPAPVSFVQAYDVPGDNGEAIRLTWALEEPPRTYFVGRRCGSDNEYRWIGATGSNFFYDNTTGTSAPPMPGQLYRYNVLAIPRSAICPNLSGDATSQWIQPIDNNAPLAVSVRSQSEYCVWRNGKVQIAWNGSAERDVAGYFICPPEEGIPTLNHSAPIDRTIGTWKPPSTTVNYQVAAVDFSGNVGPWSAIQQFHLKDADYSSSPQATALNNARKVIIDLNNRIDLVSCSDNRIMHCYNTDQGFIWHSGFELGSGDHATIVPDDAGQLHALWIVHDPPLDCPDTVQYPYPIPPPTPQIGTRRVMYARTSGGAWQQASCLFEDPRTEPGYFLAPALEISGNTVHVTFGQCHNTIMGNVWSLVYGSFSVGSPEVSNWETVDSYFGFMPPVGGVPAMKCHSDGSLHLTWALNGEIRYCYRDFVGVGPIEVLNQGHCVGADPSICINGDEVNVVWSANSELLGVEIFRRYRIWLWAAWGPIEQVSFTGSPSLLPVMVQNNVIWSENTGADYEIYRAWPQEYGWSPPENVSNSPERASVFPQGGVLVYEAGDPDSVFISYTEESSPLPYAVKFAKVLRSPGGAPLFSYDLGTETKSPVNL